MTEPVIDPGIAFSLIGEGTITACLITGVFLGSFLWHTGNSARMWGFVFLRVSIAGYSFLAAVGITRYLQSSNRWESIFSLIILWTIMTVMATITVYAIDRWGVK